MNTKLRGNIGLGQAIAYFTSSGYIVSLPLNDSQDYDLIVDMNGTLNRVDVKFTGFKERSGNYYIDLRKTGGNRSSGNHAKKFDKDKVEYIFCVISTLDKYLIPSGVITTNGILFNDNMNKYKV